MNIALNRLAATPDAAPPAFEGLWHAIEFQPELEVPQHFVIGAAVSMKGKLVAYRLAEEAPKLRCFYGDRFTPATWNWLRQELLRELLQAKDSTLSRFESASPQLRISTGHFTSGSSPEAALSRTFERIVTVIADDARKARTQGIAQADLRQRVNALLKSKLSTRFEQIGMPDGGLLIHDGDTVHNFDITHDDTSTASSVVSASYVSLGTAQLNVLRAHADLTTFSRIRQREQIGLAVLQPSTSVLPVAVVRAWDDWWREQSYKLRESQSVLLAESDDPEDLADKIADWYPETEA